MTLSIVKDSIDLGVITKNPEKMLAFYRDTLGLKMESEMSMPGGGTMYRLNCGTSVIKIIVNGKEPAAVSPPGGIQGATGYRYWTISVDNLEEAVKACRDTGYNVIMHVTEIRPGVRIAFIADPDGNWVELLQLKG